MQTSYKYRISVRLEHRIQITTIRSRNYIICIKLKQSLDFSNESNIYLNENATLKSLIKVSGICSTWSSCLFLLSAQRYNSNSKFVCYLHFYSFFNSRGQHIIFKCLPGEPFAYIHWLSTQWIHRYGLRWVAVEEYIHMSKEPP